MKIILIIATSLFFCLEVQAQRQCITMTPLLRNIYFEYGKSEIPQRYKLFNNHQETLDFNEDSLDGSTLDIYYNILNIIAYRLKNNDSINITITGCNDYANQDNNLSLAAQRANNIYNYFKNIWKIADERMRIDYRDKPEVVINAKDPVGIKENSRVEISSQNYENAHIFFKPIIKKKICHNPLNICQDFTDRAKIDSIVVDKSKWTYEKYYYTYICFNCELPPHYYYLTDSLLFPRINNNSIIQINSITDNVGLESNNSKLSQQRAKFLFHLVIQKYCEKKHINLAFLSSQGLGETCPLYPNSLPEGRFYNRTVEIIIQNPINTEEK